MVQPALLPQLRYDGVDPGEVRLGVPSRRQQVAVIACTRCDPLCS
jgi:hypothetical protein